MSIEELVEAFRYETDVAYVDGPYTSGPLGKYRVVGSPLGLEGLGVDIMKPNPECCYLAMWIRLKVEQAARLWSGRHGLTYKTYVSNLRVAWRVHTFNYASQLARVPQAGSSPAA